MEHKRVAFLDHTAKWSGGEIALFRSLSALNHSEIASTVILGEDGAFRERLDAIGIDTKIHMLPQGMREIKKDSISVGAGTDRAAIKYYFKYAIGLSQIIKGLNIDLVHCNSLKSDIYGLVAGRLSRKPVVWHIRDHINSSYLPFRVAKIFQNLATIAPNGVITNSKSTLDSIFPTKRKSKIYGVVYDGLMKHELQSPLPSIKQFWKTDPIIGMVGRISPWKGQHVFIESASILVNRGVKANFFIVGSSLFGEDEYEGEIRRKAELLNCGIQFMGFSNDIPGVLRGFDILVHCSTMPEPFGQVIIEGMAEGLPVIASDGGGVKEIINSDYFGLKTPMGDVEALSSALMLLVSNPMMASQLGQAAHQYVRESFTAEQSARAIESIYQRIY